jgi:nitrite reductase/ring-hydroxylating ferredoxin subunit
LAPEKKTKLLKIVAINGLENGQSKKFLVQRPDRKTEAFLIKVQDRYYAYLNLCRHWTVGLDFDDNDFFSEGSEWIVCKNHGALYSPETGQCESGPCGGASLYRVPIVEKEGFLYADVAKIDWGEDF